MNRLLILSAALVQWVAAGAPEADSKVNASTLTGKLIMGYQGWFACPGDGHPRDGWVHWFARNSATAATATVDLLPDVSELNADERCATPWGSRGGQPVRLFSSQNLRRDWAPLRMAGNPASHSLLVSMGISTPQSSIVSTAEDSRRPIAPVRNSPPPSQGRESPPSVYSQQDDTIRPGIGPAKQ